MVNDDDDKRGNGDDAGDNRAVAKMVNVDVMGGGLTSSGSGVPLSLSKPHDQLYPMQPYTIKPLQFYNLRIPIPPPTNS